jgi:hypothetical protein
MPVMPPARRTSALTVVVVVPMPSTRTAASLNLSLHLFHSLPIRPHNISNMSYLIKVFFQFVNLPQYIVEARNLGVCQSDRITRPVVLLLHNDLGLLSKIV